MRGDDALVAVTAGHLVARLQLALHRHEDLDHLHHARRQFVAALQLLDLVHEALVEALLAASSYWLRMRLDLGHRPSRRRGRTATTATAGYSSSISGVILASVLKPLGPATAVLPIEHVGAGGA